MKWRTHFRLRLVRSAQLISFAFLVFCVHAQASQTLIESSSELKGSDAQHLSRWGGFGESSGLDPKTDWQEIETPHFRVTFPKEIEPVAIKISQYAEEAHRVLASELKWEPSAPTQIVVIDNSDSANGFASATARQGILLLATPPENWYSTYYYEDWLKLLVLHEYTHMLNMDATRGIYVPLRYLFGHSYLPNTILPSWLLEGFAVFTETKHTNAGRGRSPYWDMILRAQVLDGKLNTANSLTLDRVNGDWPYFPSGEIAYLYGYHLTYEMVALSQELKHENDLGELSYRSSYRIPFFLNDNVENVSTKSWNQLWADWVTKTSNRVASDIKKIKSLNNALPEGQSFFNPIELAELANINIDLKDASLSSPAISLNGNWLGFQSESPHRRPGLYLLNRKTRALKRITDITPSSRMSFSPDSKTLFFSSIEKSDNYHFFSELFAYSLEDQSLTQLTQKARAKDPSVSPDGNKLTFIQMNHSTGSLAEAEIKTKERGLTLSPAKILYTPTPFSQVSSPVYATDNSTIYFTEHTNGQKQETLNRWSQKDKMTVVISDGRFNRFPTVNSRGDVFFVSDKTGIDNLYEYDAKTQSSRQLTNIETGVWFPAATPESPHTFVASVMTSHGFQLRKIGRDSGVAQSPAVIFNKDYSVLPHYNLETAPQPTTPESPNQEANQSVHANTYSPWRSLGPRQWSPFINLSSFRSYFGINVAGFDATDTYAYTASLAFDTALKSFDESLKLQTRALGLDFEISPSFYTDSIYFFGSDNIIDYIKTADLAFTASKTFRQTRSNLRVAARTGLSRSFRYDWPNKELIDSASLSDYADAYTQFWNTEGSKLAFTTERGINVFSGIRSLYAPEQTVLKAAFGFEGNQPVIDHSIVHFVLAGSYATRERSDRGFRLGSSLSPNRVFFSRPSVDSSLLSSVPYRGYSQSQLGRGAGVSSLDFQFPLKWLYRGEGVIPLYLEALTGSVFTESSAVVADTESYLLPSFGAGIHLHSTVFVRVPLVVSLDYQNGFIKKRGGASEFLVSLQLTNQL